MPDALFLRIKFAFMISIFDDICIRCVNCKVEYTIFRPTTYDFMKMLRIKILRTGNGAKF